MGLQVSLATVEKAQIEGRIGAGAARHPVLFVVFQTENLANGGAESITQVLEHLQAVQPVVVTQRETSLNERWRNAGATVHVYPGPHDGGGLGRLAALVGMNYYIRGLVRQSGARLVHCNDIRALWHAALGARLAGASIVFNIRDVKSPLEPYAWHWRLAQLADRILVLSSEMSEALSSRLPGAVPGLRTATPIDHIYSIVDPSYLARIGEDERAALRRRLGIRDGEFAIAYVAAFSVKKAQLWFLKGAGGLISTRLPDARVHFIGDFRPEQDEYTRQCLGAVARLQLEQHIVFEGYSAAVVDWYRACDLTVLASRREGLARCMIESLACGTPVVSFDVCSAKEVLQQYDCGRVVPRGNYDALVGAIQELAGNPGLRQRLGENGRRIAEQCFMPVVVTRAYERTYLKLLSKSGDFQVSVSRSLDVQ